MPNPLNAIPITPDNFRPYGQVITATPHSEDPSHTDAQLHLDSGIPRFYIMQLDHRGCLFSQITRHVKCTQCLGSLEGEEWLLAVAPPNAQETPDIDEIRAFRIPGNCFIKLELGTWHAGPYFEQNAIAFYSLELSDTNITDHHTCNLKETYGIEFEIT
jgi:ureidoglycolate hydrolase